MTDSVLRLAAEIYAPFDHRETGRLRGYVSDVEELVGSVFFQLGEQKLTLSAEMEDRSRARLSNRVRRPCARLSGYSDSSTTTTSPPATTR